MQKQLTNICTQHSLVGLGQWLGEGYGNGYRVHMPTEKEVLKNALNMKSGCWGRGRRLWFQLFWHVWKFLETNVIKTTRNTHTFIRLHAHS